MTPIMTVGAPDQKSGLLFADLGGKFAAMFTSGKLAYVRKINVLDTAQFSQKNMMLACEKDREAREDGAGVWPFVFGLGLPAAANIAVTIFAPELIPVIPNATRGIASLTLGGFGYFYIDAVFGQSILTQLFGASNALTLREKSDLTNASLALGLGGGATAGSIGAAVLEYLEVITKNSRNEMIGLGAGAAAGYLVLFPAIDEVLGISAGVATFFGGFFKLVSNPISSVINLGKDVGCLIDSSIARDVCKNNQQNSHLWDVPTLAARMAYEVMDKFGFTEKSQEAGWIYQCFLWNSRIWGATIATDDLDYVSGDYFNINPYEELGWVFNNNDIDNSTFGNKSIGDGTMLLMLEDVYANISCNSYEGLKTHLPMLQIWVDKVVARLQADKSIALRQPHFPDWATAPGQGQGGPQLPPPGVVDPRSILPAGVTSPQLIAFLSSTEFRSEATAIGNDGRDDPNIYRADVQSLTKVAHTYYTAHGYSTADWDAFFAAQYAWVWHYVRSFGSYGWTGVPPPPSVQQVPVLMNPPPKSAPIAPPVQTPIVTLPPPPQTPVPPKPQPPPPPPVLPAPIVMNPVPKPVPPADAIPAHILQLVASPEFRIWAKQDGADAWSIIHFGETYYAQQGWDDTEWKNFTLTTIHDAWIDQQIQAAANS